MSRACDLYVSNKFHARYGRVEYDCSLSETRVGYAWCTSGARRCTSLKVSARFARVWAKKIFKHAYKFSKSSACPGRVTYTSRISSTRATGALNTL